MVNWGEGGEEGGGKEKWVYEMMKGEIDFGVGREEEDEGV